MADVPQRRPEAREPWGHRVLITSSLVSPFAFAFLSSFWYFNMLAALLLVFADIMVQAQTVPASTSSAHTSMITGCHSHGADVFCINGSGQEVQVSMSATPTGQPPAQFTGCHSHGTDQ